MAGAPPISPCMILIGFTQISGTSPAPAGGGSDAPFASPRGDANEHDNFYTCGIFLVFFVAQLSLTTEIQCSFVWTFDYEN